MCGCPWEQDLVDPTQKPYSRGMSDPARAEHPRFRVHPDDEAEMRAALADVEAGRTVALTAAELAEWEATGELPASVQARFAALGCAESQD